MHNMIKIHDEHHSHQCISYLLLNVLATSYLVQAREEACAQQESKYGSACQGYLYARALVKSKGQGKYDRHACKSILPGTELHQA